MGETPPPDAVRPLTGDERLHIGGIPYVDILGSATVKHFWQWAFSRLKADVTRGVLAEFIVGRLIGADMKDLGSPDREYDLRMASGRTVEVKSSAFWQEWRTRGDKPTSPSFSGLKCKLFSPQSGFAETAKYHAELFVFCLLGCSPSDPLRELLDPLDLNQWQFYVLTQADLERSASPDRVSLAWLRSRAKECRWDELKDRVLAADAAFVVNPLGLIEGSSQGCSS